MQNHDDSTEEQGRFTFLSMALATILMLAFYLFWHEPVKAHLAKSFSAANLKTIFLFLYGLGWLVIGTLLDFIIKKALAMFGK